MLIHPHDPVGQADMRGFGHGLQVALGFPVETTIAVSRLVLAGVLLRHPNLRLLVSHGGGTLPHLAGRLDAGWRSDPLLRDRLPYPPSRDVKKLYLDSIVFHERTLHAAIDLVGVERLLYGTDHPFSIADPEVNAAALQSVAAGLSSKSNMRTPSDCSDFEHPSGRNRAPPPRIVHGARVQAVGPELTNHSSDVGAGCSYASANGVLSRSHVTERGT